MDREATEQLPSFGERQQLMDAKSGEDDRATLREELEKQRMKSTRQDLASTKQQSGEKEYKQNVDYLFEAKPTVLLEQQSLNRKYAALEEEQRDSLRQEKELNSLPKEGSPEQGLL
jgi:ParB-like chromosome segregation protein Spo0J